MRVLFLLIASIAFYTSHGQAGSFFNLTRTSDIDGKIRNYQPREKNRFFTLRVFDVSGRFKDTSVLIKPDGSFFIRFLMPFESELMMQYDGTFVYIQHQIGYRMPIEIDDRLWKANENKSKAFVSDHEMNRISAQLIDFDYHVSRQSFKTVVDWEDKGKTDEEVVNLRLQRMKEQMTFADNFFKGKRVLDYIPRFAKTRVQFDAGFEILHELFTSSRYKSYTPDQLFGLLKHFPVDSMLSVMSSDYYRFTAAFAGGLDISYNINPLFETWRRENARNKFQYLLDKIDSAQGSIYPGTWYKLLYHHLYIAHSTAQTDFFKTRFYAKTNDKLLNDNMDKAHASAQKKFAGFSLLDKLKSYDVDEPMKARLIALFESHQDKYLFLDFWGTWCAPCMREMPHYPELIKRFAGKNIRFVFMGVNTPEKQAQQVKDKYRIDAEFITLSPSEHAILKNLLSITGYPSHHLLKPGSMVMDYTGEHIAMGDYLNPGPVKKIETFLAVTN